MIVIEWLLFTSSAVAHFFRGMQFSDGTCFARVADLLPLSAILPPPVVGNDIFYTAAGSARIPEIMTRISMNGVNHAAEGYRALAHQLTPRSNGSVVIDVIYSFRRASPTSINSRRR